MLVSMLMSQNVVSLTPEDTVGSAARLLMRHDIGALPVCSKDGRIRGFVTDRDITVRCVALDNPPEETRLREIMTRGIVSVAPRDNVEDALSLMSAEQIYRLPVVENGKVIGMISLSDILRRGKYENETSRTLAEITLPKNKYKRK